MAGIVILLDTSQSMATLVAGGARRIDVLARVLSTVLSTVPGTRLVAFSSDVAVKQESWLRTIAARTGFPQW